MADAPSFVPGLVLGRAFFADIVRPQADELIGPDRYAAALLGPGSEVLRLDSARSCDHDWGPRVQLFVAQDDPPLLNALTARLPSDYAGWSLAFGADHGGSPWVRPVDVLSVDCMFTAWLGFNPLNGTTLVDWLAAPSNSLLAMTAGEVFHDGIGDLSAARSALSWYPREVWIWMIACQWRRISQEEAFVGRAYEAGDELGGRILAARLARDCVRLAFLIERRYAPYSKWLTAAGRWLDSGEELNRSLGRATTTADVIERQDALCDAYELLGRLTNELALAPSVDPQRRRFHNRPYMIGPAGDFADVLMKAVTDPALSALRSHGAIDQFVDSTDGDWPVARAFFQTVLADRSRDGG